jgi:hypothetical protein
MPRVLVVEDEANIRQFVAVNLKVGSRRKHDGQLKKGGAGQARLEILSVIEP